MPVPSFSIIRFAELWIPPDKRLPKFLAWIKSLCSGAEWLNNSRFIPYMYGDEQPLYDGTITYNSGGAVWYNFKTYESLIDGNTGNQPDISPDAWTLRCNSHIGVYERAHYNGRTLTLTYALNRQFKYQLDQFGLPGFVQPPWPAPYDFGTGGGVWPSIYITKETIALAPFVVGVDSSSSSVVDTTTDYVPIAPTYTTASSYGFVIHFPLGAFNLLGANDQIRKAVVNAFVARYAASGTHWSIVTY